MELRRRRRGLVFGVILVAVGIWLLVSFRLAGAWMVAVAFAYLLGGVAFVGASLRPFRFVIGPDGLTLRCKGINRLVPWHEIEAIILDRPTPSLDEVSPAHYLLLVPVASSPLAARATERPAPSRPAGIKVLAFYSVKDAPAEIAAVLERYGGGRFTNAARTRED
jgi:hypothetical protein